MTVQTENNHSNPYSLEGGEGNINPPPIRTLGTAGHHSPPASPSPPHLFAVGKSRAAALHRWTVVCGVTLRRPRPSAEPVPAPSRRRRAPAWRRRRAGAGLKQWKRVRKPSLLLVPGLSPPLLCTQSQSISSTSLQHLETRPIPRSTVVRNPLHLTKFRRTGRNCGNLAMSCKPDPVSSSETHGGEEFTVGEKDAVIIVDHGSRRQESNLMLNDFVAMFKLRTGYRTVEPAHMDIMNDRIKYCLRHVAGDVDECTVCAGTGKCRLYS